MPLGRGLGSLIPQKIEKQAGDRVTPAVSIVSDDDKIWHIDPSEIVPNSHQPRTDFNEAALKDLAASIKEYGVLQPIVVNKTAAGYELIAGERRWRAAKMAGLTTIPVIIRQADEQKKMELALIENIQREDLNPIELAMAYRRLADEFNLKSEELAKRVGKPSSSVINVMRFLNLPQEVQSALARGLISEGHAKIIVGLDSEVKQLELFHKVLANKITVEGTIIEVQKMGGTKKARIKENTGDVDRIAKLQEFFGAKITLRRKQRGGQIIIDFFDDEELAGILDKLK